MYKEMKIHQHDLGHMTKMAAMPIYDKKNFKNLLLGNQWNDFFETLYVAFRTPPYHSFLKYDFWLTLAYFTEMLIW